MTSVAGTARNRHAFAGDHGFVKRGMAGEDDRHLRRPSSPGRIDDDIAGGEALDRNRADRCRQAFLISAVSG
jgi:hypothetical protein